MYYAKKLKEINAARKTRKHGDNNNASRVALLKECERPLAGIALQPHAWWHKYHAADKYPDSADSSEETTDE